MITYENCPVCQNINGAGLADCPGHDDDEAITMNGHLDNEPSRSGLCDHAAGYCAFEDDDNDNGQA